MNRILVGLSVGSGLEGADVAVVRSGGVGLALKPQVIKSGRVPFPPAIRDQFHAGGGKENLCTSTHHPELTRNIAETALQAAHSAVIQAGLSPREVFAIGLLEPARPAVEIAIDWVEVADRVAEQSGVTVVHGFRSRDRAAGGSGHLITAVADSLLLYSETEERLLVHLGAATSLLLFQPMKKLAEVPGFEAGPGNLLLDALVYHGTRGRDGIDAGGKKSVQGHCLEPLLARWLEHPHLTRTPPKSVHPEAFGRSFLHAAFDTARQLGAGLPDLLCTATHLVAHAVGDAVKKWLPAPIAPRRILVSGGGVRNGFLWQLLSQQVERTTLERADAVGLSPISRNATAAAVLAALTCDGVPGNLPILTGATGGRLSGHIVPGESRNWARIAGWMSEQTGEYPQSSRAA